jgi:hypothetical protein
MQLFFRQIKILRLRKANYNFVRSKFFVNATTYQILYSFRMECLPFFTVFPTQRTGPNRIILSARSETDGRTGKYARL